MVRRIFLAVGIVLTLGLLGGCTLSVSPEGKERNIGSSLTVPSPDTDPDHSFSQEEKARSAVTAIQEQPSTAPAGDLLPLPEDLPTELAHADDLDGAGGYLLIGQVPEADIALYCDNDQIRSQVYIRFGTHFQAFGQEAWIDPTLLPEVSWTDWDGDGERDLVVDYLRHQGTYFDGTTTSPGIVGEQVVYQWDGSRWTDLHFFSGGGLQRG